MKGIIHSLRYFFVYFNATEKNPEYIHRETITITVVVASRFPGTGNPIKSVGAHSISGGARGRARPRAVLRRPSRLPAPALTPTRINRFIRLKADGARSNIFPEAIPRTSTLGRRGAGGGGRGGSRVPERTAGSTFARCELLIPFYVWQSGWFSYLAGNTRRLTPQRRRGPRALLP
ncbi:hypothetical protein EVAR_54885_1 [Eumeta japonica]|uniref:Uncharacterized protein n=1 Tax=Eumeta variegata TaxID=151549 RepID=A0A4C1ZWP0_EUMVA|nr:hypothetical protein EVAR_54885_1 [Eumeta japonica]